MNINFEYKDVSASPRLEAMATEKLEKLEAKYDFIVTTDVYFKTEKTSSADSGMITEVRMNVPGTTLFAESNLGSFEASLAKVVGEVGVQLRKRKEKMQSH
ncbi:HPF/RaiA family ribosome-associated protein [Rasiella rasia]|uniref:HPF/RaiA family ribosome-associated protein n=1 Tax=Rasiella rasia TaxID=2744027 RepID=A0A6G6GIS4_9FLAO|nr:HPF/RaiA family ribosome-associated protein [Rasiella rasia]QIE58400.1 HPF/RaiA family ribosome-associated protein [Rasiella rasia]